MADFGGSALLTDFTTTYGPFPESPLSENGRWGQPWPEQPPLWKPSDGLVSDSIHGATNYSYWQLQSFTGEVEVWACPVGGGLGAAVETWRVFMWHGSPNSGDGYLAYLGGGIGTEVVIRRYDNKGFTQIAQGGAPSADAIGLRINGIHIEMWVRNGGIWTLELTSATDLPGGETTYRGTFYIGLGIEDPTGGGLGFTCFGGGIPIRTQLYRRLRN